MVPRLIAKLARALQHAHDAGVIHRDVKPQNILIDHNGEPHLTDFGLARREAGEVTLRLDGQLLGTPAYMSPEQAGGESDIDGRSDLYSLGCVLYEMLSGEPPFTGPTAQAIIAKRFVAPIPKVRAVRDVPEAVDQAVTRALARTPVDLYPTAAQLAEALLAAREPGTTGSRTPADAQKPAQFSVYFNQDYGAGQFRGIHLQGNEHARRFFAAWMEPFRDFGLTALSIQSVGSTDHVPFNAAGLPGFQFIQDRIAGTAGHTNLDFLDTLVPEDLLKNAVVEAAYAYHAAMADERLPRKQLK